jgi:hypothetical protein
MNLLKPPFHPLLLLDCHPGPNGDALADSPKREEDHSLAQNHHPPQQNRSTKQLRKW